MQIEYDANRVVVPLDIVDLALMSKSLKNVIAHRHQDRWSPKRQSFWRLCSCHLCARLAMVMEIWCSYPAPCSAMVMEIWHSYLAWCSADRLYTSVDRVVKPLDIVNWAISCRRHSQNVIGRPSDRQSLEWQSFWRLCSWHLCARKAVVIDI